QPVVTIAVSESTKDGRAPGWLKADGAADRARAVRRQLTDAVAYSVGEELIAFAEPPTGAPAMIEVAYQVARAEGAANAVTVTWTVTLRAHPDQPPAAAETWASASRLTAEPGLADVLKEQATRTIRGMGGVPDPPPPGTLPLFPTSGGK